MLHPQQMRSGCLGLSDTFGLDTLVPTCVALSALCRQQFLKETDILKISNGLTHISSWKNDNPGRLVDTMTFVTDTTEET